MNSGRNGQKDKQFWSEVASTSRQFFKKTINSNTGLAPDYAKFNGAPHIPWPGEYEYFRYDAWRVAANIAVDYSWFAKDEWEVAQCNRILNFFYSQGIKTYGGLYTLEGKQLPSYHSTGLIAMNAVAALASTNANRKDFVEELWNAAIPSGKYRYYDSMLYMLAMLQISGNFRVYTPIAHHSK